MSTTNTPDPSNITQRETVHRYVRRIFEEHGHCVVETDDDLEEVYDGRETRVRTVVLIADKNTTRRTNVLLGGISAVDPDCRPLVVHDGDDVRSASIALRHGAYPCPLRLGTDGTGCDPDLLPGELADGTYGEVLHPAGTTDPAVAMAIAQNALQLSVDGRMLDAIVELSAIDGIDATAAAVEHLADVCASLVTRIGSRSRYPIPVELVMARLDVATGSDVGLCYTMMQRTVFRASGLDLDLDELLATHGWSGVLFGAFHSAHALIRFTGERWWRTPRSILEELDATNSRDGWL